MKTLGIALRDIRLTGRHAYEEIRTTHYEYPAHNQIMTDTPTNTNVTAPVIAPNGSSTDSDEAPDVVADCAEAVGLDDDDVAVEEAPLPPTTADVTPFRAEEAAVEAGEDVLEVIEVLSERQSPRLSGPRGTHEDLLFLDLDEEVDVKDSAETVSSEPWQYLGSLTIQLRHSARHSTILGWGSTTRLWSHCSALY